MKNYLRIALMLISIPVFSASERSVWMEPLKMTGQGIMQSNGKTNDARYGFVKIKQETENVEHTRYNLTYKNTPIWGHQIIVHKQRNKQPLLSGVLVNGIEQDIPNNQHLMTKTEATSKILSGFSTSIKAKQIQKIVYLDDNKIAHNGYLLSFYTHQPRKGLINPHYIIDANTGSIFKQWDEIKTFEPIKGEGIGGNAVTLPYRDGAFQYGNSIPNLPSLDKFPMEHWSFWCYMQTPDYQVVNMENTWLSYDEEAYLFPILVSEEELFPVAYDICWPWTKVFNNTNDQGFAPVNEIYSPINDAMYFLNETMEMYHAYGITHPLGLDLPLRVYTHISGIDNAHYIPTFYFNGKNKIVSHQQIILGNGFSLFTGTTQSIIGHEISHGFTDVNSGLIYSEQSGGINESFSDMAAIALLDRIHEKHPFYWDGLDWSLGRESMKDGKPLRYLEHPALDGISIEHVKDYTNETDVHHSSGVFNRAFYLLAHQPGWSIHNAFQIMVDANKNYWQPDSTFNQAACGVIQAAKDRKMDPAAIIDSFEQVGVACAGA